MWGYAHTRTCAVAGQDKLKNGTPALISSNHWPLKRNSVCCFPLPSLVHWSTSTNIQRRGHGHNKSAKIKTYENLIIKMFQQKTRNFNPYEILYPYCITVFPSAGYYTGLYNFMRLAFFIIKANETSCKNKLLLCSITIYLLFSCHVIPTWASCSKDSRITWVIIVCTLATTSCSFVAMKLHAHVLWCRGF